MIKQQKKKVLKVIRDSKGLTLLEASLLTGLTQACISRLETGRRTGSRDTWKRLALLYGYDVEFLSIEL
jgi:transcriptional regulator with XRE-family HTH domain